MADANQFKIEARRKEASGDYAAASQLYQRALSAMEANDSLPDPSLLVRVADLEYRQDERASALGYYHRAVEDYAEQGLITNAIAVCNKILRVFPDEITCYRRLADLHMDVGLVAEARQNMLRFVDQAWEEGKTDPAIEAMEELLARSPDQEIALKLATTLARLDRQEDALEVLARVWRERTRADADVEALERKARDLDPDVDLDEWLPPSGEDEEPGLAGAESFVSDEPAPVEEEAPVDEPVAEEPAAEPAAAEAGVEEPAPAEREVPIEEPAAEAPEPAEATPPEADVAPEPAAGDTAEEPPAPSPLDELAAAAEGLAGLGSSEPPPPAPEERPGGASEERERREDEERAAVAASGPAIAPNRLAQAGEDAGEVELVASFPDWFTEMTSTRPSNGSSPAPAASSTERSDPWEEKAMDELDELEARAETTAADEGTGFGSPEPGAGLDASEGRPAGEAGGRPPGHGEPGGTGAPAEPRGGAPEAEPRGTAGVEPGTGGPSGQRDAAGAGGPEPEARRNGAESGPDEGGLGEKEELRRGLELLDDLLEVDPDNTDLKERKVRYARRLGDREVLVDAFLDLADAMAERGSRRGARLLYDKVLELDEGNQRAEAGLGRLDRGELEQKRQTGKRAGAAHAEPRDPSPEEQEARRHLGMRLWTEFEKAVQEMPWLHAATQTYQATRPEAAPPVEAFEMLAHYLISRDRCREAAEILEQAIRVADRSDEEIADALYYLGLAHERLGETDRAADYYRRLAAVDPEFASVREWLPEDRQAGA